MKLVKLRRDFPQFCVKPETTSTNTASTYNNKSQVTTLTSTSYGGATTTTTNSYTDANGLYLLAIRLIRSARS
jgi:hypothetical protein